MNPVAEDILMHYGVKRRSGRYPWGSGDSPYQHSGDFLSRIEELKKSGRSETQIAEELGIKTTELRVLKQIASHERRQLEVDRIRSLKEDGLSTSEIGRIMGKNESSIRSLLNENTEARANTAKVTADYLKKELETKKMIDVGIGVERELGVSQNTLKEALYMLELEGYNRYGVGIPQVTNPGRQSNAEILCRPDITYGYAYKNMGEIESVGDYHSTDGGKTFHKREYPASMSSDRIKIRYGDEGGTSKDGVIEIRRGVADLDLGSSHYAQVRILVDGTHYLKGMAMYSDDLPEGTDIMFNTNKKSGTPKMDVLKKIKTDDPENPFGAYIKADGQSHYIDKDGKEKLSCINKLREEGEWGEMSKNLSSQFLSKQPMQLIKKQLNLTYDDANAEFDEICSLTNPTIKKKLLLDFANNCDAATSHLKAAALPRQRIQVLLPVDQLKDNEIYAPNYNNGEKLALVRYPHGGTFEIPVLTVNNKNPAAKSILGNAIDAVGINSKVAERLSGADFDGDTAIVIPTNDKVKIKSTPPLKGLEGFDPKSQYAYTEGMRVMTKSMTQKQMGIVSNLITDMTLQGAPDSEIARAVKHSMVVIDAEKHKLNYKQSEKDQGIAELKKKYQTHIDENGVEKSGGASTLISKKKRTVDVPERQGAGVIDPVTGKVTYKETGRTYVDKKTGEVVKATTKIKLMDSVDDAHVLSSGTPQEKAYADYANRMKDLAAKARIEYKATGKLEYSSNAKQAYQKEVDSLNAKLNIAAKNAPRERRAQALANSKVKAITQDNPNIDKKELKKIKQMALDDARASVGASGKDTRITITDSEWSAIQAGAISDSNLTKILRYTDTDSVRERATPRATTQLSTAQVNRIKSMSRSGYSNAEIAKALGKSVSTISSYVNY